MNNKPLLIEKLSDSSPIGKRQPPEEVVRFEPLDEEYHPKSTTFNEKDRKQLLRHALPFSAEDYEAIVLGSTRILVAATYSSKVSHTTKTPKGYTSVRYLGQVVAISLDEQADGELRWCLVSPLAVTGQKDSDRAWQSLYAIIETFANLITIDGRQAYFLPNYEPKAGKFDIFNAGTRDLCYITEWLPSEKWFEDHGDRPALSKFESIYNAAKRFVYEPLGDDGE